MVLLPPKLNFKLKKVKSFMALDYLGLLGLSVFVIDDSSAIFAVENVPYFMALTSEEKSENTIKIQLLTVRARFDGCHTWEADANCNLYMIDRLYFSVNYFQNFQEEHKNLYGCCTVPCQKVRNRKSDFVSNYRK